MKIYQCSFHYKELNRRGSFPVSANDVEEAVKLAKEQIDKFVENGQYPHFPDSWDIVDTDVKSVSFAEGEGIIKK